MFYSALVVSNADFEYSGKIEVYVPVIMSRQKKNNPEITEVSTQNKFTILNGDMAKKVKGTIKTKQADTIFAYPFYFTEERLGTQMIPDVGNEVFIFFKDNNYEVAYYMPGNAYKKGKIMDYGKLIEDESNANNPDEYTKHRVLLRTPNDHVIVLNDTVDSNGVLIKCADKHKIKMDSNKDINGVLIESEKGHKLLLDDKNDGLTIKSKSEHAVYLDDRSGGINIQTAGGTRVTMDDKKKLMQIVTANGIGLEFDDKNNKLRIDSMDNEITVQNTASIDSKNSVIIKSGASTEISTTKLDMKAEGTMDINSPKITINADGSIDIKCSGIVNVEGQLVNVEGSQISLGKSASSFLLKGPEFMQYMATHTHTAPPMGGPTTPPIIPPTPDLLSMKVKTE